MSLSQRLWIRTEPGPSSHLIELTGELDELTGPGVEAALAVARSSGAAEIVLDLSEVDFIDSGGIVLLLAAMRRSEGSPQGLKFVASRSESVRRLLELCGLEGRLPFVTRTGVT